VEVFSATPYCNLSSGFVYAFLAKPSHTQAANGSISGRVVSESGGALSAIVSLQPAAARGFPSGSRRVLTVQNGSFQFQRLPAGRYLVCAQIPQSESAHTAAPFLDTCVWGSAQAPISVATGQQVEGVTFTAPRGTLLQIRVVDPEQVLPQALPAKGPPTLEPQLQLVVRGSDHRVHHAQFLARDTLGRSYQIVVPGNAALGLTVTSSVANAFDANNRPIQAEIAVQAAAGAVLSPITFTLHRNGH